MSAGLPVRHAGYCPAPEGPQFDCLCGADPRSVKRPLPHSTSKKRKPEPNGGPPRPVNAAERRMIERGRRAGYELGRHGTAIRCPYHEESRSAWLWIQGAAAGLRVGQRDLAVVQESYRRGLKQLEAGPPKVW